MGPEIVLVVTVYVCSGTNTFLDHPQEGCSALSEQESKGGFGMAESSKNRRSRVGLNRGTASDRDLPPGQMLVEQKKALRLQHCRDYEEWIALGKKVHGRKGATREEMERHHLLSQSFAKVPTPKCEPS
ncbi:MAG: hypothetical protein FJ245_09215 [Nitrospira sp.]|nr:hypothetical protein [Nitrospira sp.]